MTPQPHLLGPARTPLHARVPPLPTDGRVCPACVPVPLGWVFSVLVLIKPLAFPRHGAACLRLGSMLLLSRLPSEFSVSLVTL